MNALVDGWKNTLLRFRDDVALVDVPCGRRWSFGDLDAAAAERAKFFRGQSPIFPRENEPAFVVETLAALKSGAVVCPLEAGARLPPLAGFAGLSPMIVLTKLTSGSMGAPRIVLFTADQLIADVDNIVASMGLDHRLPNVAAISLAHSYGFSNLVLPLLLHGIPMRLAGSPLPEAVRRALPREGEITLPGVPAMWSAWHAAGVIDQRVRIGISAGAPLPLELERDVFETTSVKIHNFLGSTECGGIAYDRSGEPRSDTVLAGTAMDNVAVEVDHEDRLVVRSDAVGAGYWPATDGDAEVLGDGRFRTSDIAELSDGLVRLLGRAGDVINVAGRKVHPAEIEACLRKHPDVKECIVFGVPSEAIERGGEIVAYVSLHSQAPSVAHLTESLAAGLPSWKTPRHWRLVPSLSANERGKIPRHEWQRKFLSERAPAEP